MTTSTETYPILEHDPSPTALIEPSRVLKPLEMMPAHAVLCFFQEVIEKTCRQTNAPVVHQSGSEIGRNPVFTLKVDERHVAVMHPGVGAPLAAAFMEELIALGCRKIIAVGGSGVLNRELTVGHAIIPMSAVRDEGTSYHYLPPGREVEPSAAAVDAIRQTLEHHHVPYVQGKAWTTDAIYRETPAKIARRKAEGCLCVEMEAAAFFAVAQFRGITFGQLLYGGDDVSGDEWDERDWINGRASTREMLFRLAVEACLRL
jgi:uridine phosphorylase